MQAAAPAGLGVAGQAGATVAARPVAGRPRRLGSSIPQPIDQCGELGDLVAGSGDLVGHELMEAALHRRAPLAVPDRDEVGDLLERAAELLGTADERQPTQGVVVVEPGSRRRCALPVRPGGCS